CVLKSQNVKDQDPPRIKEEEGEEEVCGSVGVFFKECHAAMTSILFAFQNCGCASWPVMREKRSRACPALVLRAGRAE
ncbi:hypothetical protein, partial [Klebsiella pneumoniae]|uniref:hypothetical protein n=1 Tax=Klebsiella pneumoniae TaxID=573 RepID=UPI00210EFB8F